MERNIKHHQVPNKYGADKENKYSEAPECFKPSLTQLFAAEKMRRQKEYANAIREQNKKTNKLPITPTKEPQHKDVPRMKAAQTYRKEREQEIYCSPTCLAEELHVSEIRAELRDSWTSSQPLVHTEANRYLPQQEDTQLLLQGLEGSPGGRSADTYEVLSPVEEPPRRKDDEQGARAASDGYLVWMKKKQQSVIQSAKMAEKMRRKRENINAKKKNTKINKMPVTPAEEPEDKDIEDPRMKAAQINAKAGEPQIQSRLAEELQVSAIRAEPRESRTSSQPLVHTEANRYLPQQEDTQLLLQGLEGSPGERPTAVPGSYEVLSPMKEPPRTKDDERRARAASDGEKKQPFNTNVCHQAQEQKKKMKRKAFVPTKKPKDQEAPRMKTLEFVTTLGKPMEGLDISKLSRLDFLMKQHKEEKRAVALLFK